MERNSLLSSNLKPHNTLEGDFLGGYPWPPRSYTCSFCKREFRSAQALGGHMNVHRRDRARMRQSPPPPPPPPRNDHFLLNLNLNPNPNFSSSSHSSSSSPPSRLPTLLPHLVSPSLSSFSSSSPAKTLFGAEEFDGFARRKECMVFEKAEFVRLELGIGMHGDQEDDLDLELRLGYS